MATVNYAGRNMIGLTVVLPAYATFEGLTGEVTAVDMDSDLILVTWEGPTGGPLNYECDKFEFCIGADGLFLVLHLD